MMLSDVCLSVAYIGPKSRTERPRETKIGTEVAHVTRDSDTTFKAKRLKVNLQGVGHIMAASHTACFYWLCDISHCACRSGLAVAYLTAVHEVLGSNCAVGSCVYRTTTVIYSLTHTSCVHLSCSA